LARSVTIRTSLLASVGLLILLLTAAVVAITVYTGNQVVEVASRRLIDRALDRSESELRGFFGPIARNLDMARRWVESGALDLEDDEALEAFFRPMMQAYPQISAVHTGDAEGRGWILMRTPDGWRSRRVDPPALGGRVRHRTLSEDGGVQRAWVVDDPAPDERYDPRTRDWYRTAVEGADRHEAGRARPAQVYWTEPYVFFTNREPGITGTIHVDVPSGARALLAFDVLLRDVSEFTRSIEITPNGFVGLLSSDRRLVGVPRHPAFDSPEAVDEALLQAPGDLGVEVFDDAIAARAALGLPAVPEPGDEGFFSFVSGGERHWSDVRTVPIPPDRHYLVVVTVPERDLLGPIRRLRNGVGLLAGLALLTSVVGAWWLSRSYSRPLSTLARQSARIRHLDLQSTAPVDSSITEIAQLAGAQESMRTALDAFSRYVPTDVVRELVELGEAARIGGERKTLSVLFSDIEGFTRIAERKSPEDLTRHLAKYFDELLPILDELGTVDKLVGDGIMAFWGAPLPDPHHARHAVEAVLACV
jgi:adenylate cyclase